MGGKNKPKKKKKSDRRLLFFPSLFPGGVRSKRTDRRLSEARGDRGGSRGACLLVFSALWRGSAVAGLVRPSLDWTWRDCGCVWSARCDWDAQPSPPLPLPGLSHLLGASDCFPLSFAETTSHSGWGRGIFFFSSWGGGGDVTSRGSSLSTFLHPLPPSPRILQECAPAQTFGCVWIKDRLGNV